MSRLDSVIRRLQAQRACLDRAATLIAGQKGVVLEMGLGNGRTFDHLRSILPDREIFVFEREVHAHPDCVPDESHLYLGDMRETLEAATASLAGRAILVHADIGTGDEARNQRFAAFLGPAVRPLLAQGAVIVCDQELDGMKGLELALPADVAPGRYFMYQMK